MVVAPSADLTVVDVFQEAYFRCAGEVWQQYSVEAKSHEVDLTTDSNGRIELPARVIRASRLGRGIGCIGSIVAGRRSW